jgi:hypothetical protein
LHGQALDDADEHRGGGGDVQIRWHFAVLHGVLQQLRQQLAVALQQQAELALQRRIGGLLQVVEDQARHARAFAHELDMGGEDPGEGVECRVGSGLAGRRLRRIFKSRQQVLRHPFHDRQPDRLAAGEMLEQRTLCHPDFPGDVAGGDGRRAVAARQRDGRCHDQGLTFFGR